MTISRTGSVKFAIAALAVLALLQLYARDADDEDQKAAVPLPSRLSVENGQAVLRLNAATQQHLGLTVAALRPLSARHEAVTAATILPVQDLVTLRTAYISAQAQMEKANASLVVSGEEYRRLKKLYEEHQDTSLKSVEAAEALTRTDQATLAAAEQGLTLQRFGAQQSWGSVVANWVATGSPALDQTLNQSSLLVQVTLPSAPGPSPSHHITLSTLGGPKVMASYLSPLPRVSPLLQRASLLYLTRARPGLAPGMNLLAHLPEGMPRRGVLIPQSAVVWWQGEAWIYQRLNSTRFVRRLVSTDTPVEGGYFTAAGFSDHDQVVIRGAQFLLSEEFRSQIQAQD